VSTQTNNDIAFRPGQTIGIDLGTTFSSVAQLNSSGVSCPIKNHDGKLTTPAIVLLGDNGHIHVGPSADVVATAAALSAVISVS